MFNRSNCGRLSHQTITRQAVRGPKKAPHEYKAWGWMGQGPMNKEVEDGVEVEAIEILNTIVSKTVGSRT